VNDDTYPDPTPPEYRFGDTVVVIYGSIDRISPGCRRVKFVLKRLGMVRVYEMEINKADTDALNGRDLANYLRVHARHRSLVFAYPEP
jgi:hypothetical protein